MEPSQKELIEARINIARLETEVAHLTASMAEMRESQVDMAQKIDAMLSEMSAAKGGWRTLMLVGGAASTLGAGLSWVIAHLPKGMT